MLATNSAIYKMIKHNQERQIYSLPRPFLSCATPNKQINFSTLALEASKYIASGLGISKAIFVGDVAVGKTSLVNRFCHRIFDTNYKATIGVDFEVERFEILNVPFNLQIWDTAGQERFKCIAQSYYRGASAIVVLFSLCDSTSLKHTQSWLNEALRANCITPLIFLVGTKRDKVSSTTYIAIENEAIKIAKEMNAEYWAVSSKTGDCVNNFFNRLAALAFEMNLQNLLECKSEKAFIGNPLSLMTEAMNKTKKSKTSCDGKCK